MTDRWTRGLEATVLMIASKPNSYEQPRGDGGANLARVEIAAYIVLYMGLET